MSDETIPVPTPVSRPFFWKFSRDGAWSKTYISFIFDVPSSQLNVDATIWSATFNQLKTVLLLLQDVELLNKNNLQKQAFIDAVNKCGYMPPTTTTQLRDDMRIVFGSADIGRHSGTHIPFGFYDENAGFNTVELDVSQFTPALLLSGSEGKILKSRKGPTNSTKDLLQCYRTIGCYNQEHNYWDLMPKHSHMKEICQAMSSLDPTTTETFLTQILKWQKRTIAVSAAVAAPSPQ
jgi:hypothetical protein